jgi:hypothetical protein
MLRGTFMLALALADDAFKNKFTSLKDIYNLVVPRILTAFVFNGMTNWLNGLSSAANGIRISKTKALQYTKR